MSLFLKKLQSAYESAYEMKNYTKPKIYHGGEKFDVKKRWYVYYDYVNPDTGKMERQTTITLGLNREYKDVKERLSSFRNLRDILEKHLEKGYSPYEKGIFKTEETQEYNTGRILDFALELKKQTLGLNTFKDYESKVNTFKDYLKKKDKINDPISEIKRKDINDFLNYILGRNNSSPTNRNNYRAVLSSVFSILEDNEYIGKNFIKNIKLLQTRPERNKTYSSFEVDEILDYVDEHDATLALLIKLVSYNFLRPIEACRLQVKDIDLKSTPPILRVNAKNKAVKTKIIPSIIVEELNKLDLSNPNAHLLTHEGVVETLTSEEERRSYFTKRFAKVKKEFGLGSDYGIYSFRHTFITKIYRELRKDFGQFETYDKLMLITGHSSLDSLKKYLRDIDAELPEDYSDMF